MFRSDGRTTVLDWQGLAWGRPGWEVAYFITTALEAHHRAEEQTMLSRYHETLVTAGVSNYSFDDLLEDVTISKAILAHRMVAGDDLLDTEIEQADSDFIVGTWWNHEIIKAKAQISGISGRIIDQTVTFKGKEEVKIGDKTYKTLRFNFKSSDETLPDSKKLNTDIWYEEDTYLWVKAAFEKTGYWEYRIKTFN